MTLFDAGDADFQQQSLLELRPISVWTQLFGVACWLASLVISPTGFHFPLAWAAALTGWMLLGTLLSQCARQLWQMTLGILLNITALATAFRLCSLATTDLVALLLPIAVCITLTMAPVFNNTLPFLCGSAMVWGILDHDVLTRTRIHGGPNWILLLIAAAMLSGLILQLLFRRLRLNGYRLRAELQELAYQDPLTGIDNRRSLLEKLQAQYLRAPGHFLMLDVDDFKQINDQFGHESGDLALQEVAAVLNGHPAAALCGRLGGEEFGLFIAESDPLRVAAAAKDIIRQVNACKVGSQSLGISIGAAWLDSRTGLAASLKRADAALYEAKRSGKNRMVLALRHSPQEVRAHGRAN